MANDTDTTALTALEWDRLSTALRKICTAEEPPKTLQALADRYKELYRKRWPIETILAAAKFAGLVVGPDGAVRLSGSNKLPVVQ